jgi:hypothetical protein
MAQILYRVQTNSGIHVIKPFDLRVTFGSKLLLTGHVLVYTSPPRRLHLPTQRINSTANAKLRFLSAGLPNPSHEDDPSRRAVFN